MVRVPLGQIDDLPSSLEVLDRPLLDTYPPLRSFAQALGRTPLIEVPGPPHGGRIFAKCEWLNPTGSVKDRTALALIYDLLRRVRPVDPSCLHILEYSGGNLAIALSRLCRELGISRTLVMASFMSSEELQSMRSEGSLIDLVDKQFGFWAVMERAFILAREHPDWHFLYQHENEANLWFHRMTTGRELLVQLKQVETGEIRPDAWVASIGTGGTLIGVYDALVEAFPNVAMVAVTPAELPYGSLDPPNGLPKYAGSGGLGCGRRQSFVARRESSIADRLTVSFDQTIIDVAAFAALTGLWIGSSAAANWGAAFQVAQRLGYGSTVVTLFPSGPTASEKAKAQALPSSVLEDRLEGLGTLPRPA
jgi:cysteine synthase A